MRANPDGDPAGEARALIALTSVTSPVGSVEECLAFARRALEIGRALEDPFLIAVAQETVGNTLARTVRLDEARTALDQSVQAFRELGARWELASALGDRGNVFRIEGRLAEAAADLREALAYCRELGEQNLVTWTSSTLGQVLLLDGDRAGAERLADETEGYVHASDPAEQEPSLPLRILLALADGDRAAAERLARRLLERERDPAWPNQGAARTWWVGRLLGAELVGGAAELASARERLERVGWETAIGEPDRIRATLDRLAAVAG